MDHDRKDERVSLEGLDPVEALKALLKVDPDAEPVPDDDQPSDDQADADDDE